MIDDGGTREQSGRRRLGGGRRGSLSYWSPSVRRVIMIRACGVPSRQVSWVISAWIPTRTIHVYAISRCDRRFKLSIVLVMDLRLTNPCRIRHIPVPITLYSGVPAEESGGPQAGAATGLRLVVGSIHNSCCGFLVSDRVMVFQSADLRDGIVRGLGQISKFRLGGVFTLTSHAHLFGTLASLPSSKT